MTERAMDSRMNTYVQMNTKSYFVDAVLERLDELNGFLLAARKRGTVSVNVRAYMHPRGSLVPN
jgi:hypothetical protein